MLITNLFGSKYKVHTEQLKVDVYRRDPDNSTLEHVYGIRVICWFLFLFIEKILVNLDFKTLNSQVCIDDPDEHLTAIKMTFGEFEGQPVIQSLSCCTNLNKYGSYGSKYGTSVSIPIDNF